MTSLVALTASLEASAPAISPDEVRALTRDLYGLDGDIASLGSERDANFRLRGETVDAVIKITNAAEPVEVTALQTAMLLHLEQVAPHLPVPRMVRTIAGAPDCRIGLADGGSHVMRLLSVLPGSPSFAPFAARDLASLASTVAELDHGLSTFRSDHGRHDLLWDVAHADRVGDLVPHIADPDDRALATAALGRWSAHVAPALDGLRWQVIHNDLNRYNLLFDDTRALTGIIDFGDAIEAPLIAELAIAIAYFADADRLVDDAATIAVAYHRRLPLEAGEVRLLFDLIAARHALTLAITGWRAARHPHNRDYILRNAPNARRGLQILADRPADLTDRLLHACAMEQRA